MKDYRKMIIKVTAHAQGEIYVHKDTTDKDVLNGQVNIMFLPYMYPSTTKYYPEMASLGQAHNGATIEIISRFPERDEFKKKCIEFDIERAKISIERKYDDIIDEDLKTLYEGYFG